MILLHNLTLFVRVKYFSQLILTITVYWLLTTTRCFMVWEEVHWAQLQCYRYTTTMNITILNKINPNWLLASMGEPQSFPKLSLLTKMFDIKMEKLITSVICSLPKGCKGNLVDQYCASSEKVFKWDLHIFALSFHFFWQATHINLYPGNHKTILWVALTTIWNRIFFFLPRHRHTDTYPSYLWVEDSGTVHHTAIWNSNEFKCQILMTFHLLFFFWLHQFLDKYVVFTVFIWFRFIIACWIIKTTWI